MQDALQSFQFDTFVVRVVVVEGEPWWVASDLAAVLGYRDAANMIRMLPDEWKGTHLMSTIRGETPFTIVAEGGMWTAIARSNKPKAIEVQRWMFGEVMPSIRKTGSYRLFDPAVAPAPPAGAVLEDGPTERWTAAIGVVREARQIFGAVQARSIWQQVGLPMPIVEAVGDAEADPLVRDVATVLADKAEATIEDIAGLLGWDARAMSLAQRRRIGAALRLLGWRDEVERRGARVVRVYRPIPRVTAAQPVEG